LDKKTKISSAISIAPHLFASNDFDKLYDEGMHLIEETAAYLDGDGRKESRNLNREAALIYARESMRLTTKLMQLASWLLLQKAVSEGEITSKGAREEKLKIRLSTNPLERGGPGWDDVPTKLIGFIAKGDRLYERISQFDKLDRSTIDEISLEAENSSKATGGISDQLSRIQSAFGNK